MIYSENDAIDQMDQWGREEVPFFFIIDFEMKKIQLFNLDDNSPKDISFVFPGYSLNADQNLLKKQFYFKKSPISIKKYKTAFNKVIDEILQGNSFLVNLTFSTPIETKLTLQEIFNFSNARYKLFLKDSFVVFSPETFITIKDGFVNSFPMKGTIKATIANAQNVILSSIKETAEHNTIVDLIRNDLSLISSDVTVKRFRYIEKINTNQGEILQVSSEISGKLPHNYHQKIGTILFKLLPAGSVSGAPKKKTIDIIHEVEKEPRGYYTGVCGYFDGISLDSAVMIRYIEKDKDGLRFRSGGGITCNSILEDEYNELIDKVYVSFN